MNLEAMVLGDLNRALAAVVAEHGISALEAPRRAACVHEAAHAVMFAAEGEPVRSVRIKSRHRGGRPYWGGYTDASSPWTIGTHTDPEADLRRVRFEIAGYLAEQLFAADELRAGSSLDERIRAERICELVSFKLGDPPGVLLQRQCAAVRATLRANEKPLLALAGALAREQVVRGLKLQAHLADVRRSN